MDASSSSSSSSSSFPPITREKYDVFLSFRGVDTRDTFTSHLYTTLCQKNIETYIDNRLEAGDEISPSLLTAIEGSKLSVIIFSENYASSTWCLDELLHIIQCKEKKGQLVIPVFYHVEPRHVRRQKESYATAFAKHEKRFKDGASKVQAWKVALNKAANIAGWDSSALRPESKLIEAVVEDILKKLNRISSNHNDFKGLVGIGRRIEQIEVLMHPDSLDVRIVGIWGMGGVGKTTLANVIYNRLSSQFEGCCFVANVREEATRQGLVTLRNKLLVELLQQGNLYMGPPSLGSPFVKERLRRKKVLVVLDDVNDLEQVECLAGDHESFGRGSRIIVTTRDVQVLKHVADGTYNVEELNDDEALELFSLRAFKRKSPTEDYMELSKKVVAHAKGIPLALVVSGSNLHSKSKDAWESALTKLNKVPHNKIQNVLRISYDGLDPDQKEVFLDIACFYKGQDIRLVQRILDGCGFSTKIEVETLSDNALITTVANKVQMHDLLHKMGQEIVRQESMKDPGNRSRLCMAEDICHVFRTNTGSAAIEGICLDMSKIGKLHLSPTTFLNMRKLRLLKIYNASAVEESKVYLSEGLQYLPDALRYLHWDGYPLQAMPSQFTPQNLVELNMSYSQVERLWNGVQDLMNLKRIDLSHSKHLIEVPDLSKAPNIEILDLEGCSSIDKLPELPRNVKELCLNATAIKQVPSSIERLFDLHTLDLIDCKRLECLPTSICRLKSLESLDLSGCSKLESLPEILEPMENLTFLYLRETAIKEIPSSLENLNGLEVLNLDMSKNLEFIHEKIFKLTRLEHLILSGCSKLENLPSLSVCFHQLIYLDLTDSNILEVPEWFGLLSSLQRLDLVGTFIEEMPPSIKGLSNLGYLDVSNCKNLRSLPELPLSLGFFSALGCTSLETVPSSRTALTQGLDQFRDFGNFVFFNCLKLDRNSRNNIMDDAQLRILHVATMSWLKHASPYGFDISCFGSEIPTWFNYQCEGSSIHIKLPTRSGNTEIMGFVISVVASFEDYDFDEYLLRFQCKSLFKTDSGEISKFDFVLVDLGGREDNRFINSDHVFLSYWYGPKDVEKQRTFTEVSFSFYPVDITDKRLISSCKVKNCGIHLLYVEHAEEFGFINNHRERGNSDVVADQARTSRNGIVSSEEEAEQDDEEPHLQVRYERRSTFCDCFSFLSRFL